MPSARVESRALVVVGLAGNLAILLVPAVVSARIPSAARLYIGLFLLGASALCLADLAGVASRPALRPDTADDRRVKRMAWAQALTVLLLFWTGLTECLSRGAGVPPFPAPVRVLGLVLMLAGAALRYAAIRRLGPQFTTEIRAGPTLVRRGIYAHIRHPSEMGLVLGALGAGLILSSAFAFIVAIVLVAVIFVRTRMEDAALSSAFGEGFVSYRHEVGGFFPHTLGRVLKS